ncbi:hypothetical protein L1987_20022 [Smallanthus sonchifolius]|uniref:Uncharacterized protein n=1 Tax=Smallanthus sonchifolius TaxID=185202 RepID=A0ACB9ISR4_9ASTR|nr:hypothetical protein L1987_20022 [Smallanthus sonchifolius]
MTRFFCVRASLHLVALDPLHSQVLLEAHFSNYSLLLEAIYLVPHLLELQVNLLLVLLAHQHLGPRAPLLLVPQAPPPLCKWEEEAQFGFLLETFHQRRRRKARETEDGRARRERKMIEISNRRSLGFVLSFSLISLQFLSGFSDDSKSQKEKKTDAHSSSSSMSGSTILILCLAVATMMSLNLVFGTELVNTMEYRCKWQFWVRK